MDDINPISRVEFVPARTRTADSPLRKKAGKLKPQRIYPDEDEFHLQPELVPDDEESGGEAHLDIEA